MIYRRRKINDASLAAQLGKINRLATVSSIFVKPFS